MHRGQMMVGLIVTGRNTRKVVFDCADVKTYT
jgi:hypothetical protein